ncbi:fibrous sheath CABYR-binding protein-like [Sceloporus undulatus]|uniref:fibrous sheath CABYR-binding protein-like n=1 Tax=Sceloporus undulatus TaxID=8520 RepID=UPI001C4DD68C|nr:fibrous sheath CABYR-binding protein-like [Sceloporus undulatus]XP_042299977.1 fibrous sheath CABYR-binding protein-like [Sceloporus undulatus]
MDFKPEAISGADVPTEPLEPPPMDLEETSGPQHPTEDLPSAQQPSPASGGVEVTLTPPPNMESSNPGMAEIQTSLGEAQSPEWLLDPQDSSPQVHTEVGLEGSRNAMEEGVTEPPREQRSWVMNPGIDAEVGNGPQAPSSIDQSDPLMELEEKEEDIVAEDVPEVDQIQLQGLVTQLERLSPSFHDSSPTSEDGLLPASDGEESPVFGRGTEEKGHLLKCRGPPGECGPCPLHIATGHGLGAPSHWPPQLIRGPRKSRGLLSAETNPEDLLSLLCYEGGIPSEPDAQIPLAHSDVVAGSGGGQKLKAGERAEMSLGPSEEAEREEPCQWDPREGAVQEEKTSLDCGVGPSQKGEPSPDSAGIISPEVSDKRRKRTSYSSWPSHPSPCFGQKVTIASPRNDLPSQPYSFRPLRPLLT